MPLETVEESGSKKPTTAWESEIAPKPFSLDDVLSHVDEGLKSRAATIVVGIGGTAAQVLQGLRGRINERIGRLREIPAIRLLLIDSDVRQLNQVNRDEDAWKEIETLATPLRRSEEYRPQDPKLKGWMNRRWLFNIPRDQSTDGIRALGRLALLSNHQRVFSAVDQAIGSITAPESLAQSSETLGCPVRAESPRVILVASLCGGTGQRHVVRCRLCDSATAKERGASARSC